jgi:hypothetical protein
MAMDGQLLQARGLPCRSEMQTIPHPAQLLKRVVNRMARPFGVYPFPRTFPNPFSSPAVPVAEIFDRVWRENYWGSPESRSGRGSQAVRTATYRRGLRELFKARGFHRIFDAPSGDLNWMSSLVAETKLDYLGGDISPLVVEDARSRHPHLETRLFDITRDPFPQADVWHCRDCLFHLPYADIRRALNNFVDSSTIPYALLTTYRSWLPVRNLDVPVGGFRYLDLEAAPIALAKAEHYIADYLFGWDFPRYVGLWSRQSVARALLQWRS